jgi:Tol biopolymer transport system component
MTSHGGKRRRLTRGKAGVDSPSYSASGRRIAFSGGYQRSDLWTTGRPTGAGLRTNATISTATGSM